MYLLIIFLWTPVLTHAGVNVDPCAGLHGNLNLKTLAGKWHMVAIIPSDSLPDTECFSVGAVETDLAKLRSLVHKTPDDSPENYLSEALKAIVVRQKYYSERLFDLMARSVKGIRGCFQQALSLDIRNPEHKLVNDIFSEKLLPYDGSMGHLHVIDAMDGSEPFLIHIFFGNPASVLIYRKSQYVTQTQLKPVVEYIHKVYGPHVPPKICQNTFLNLDLVLGEHNK